MKTTNKIIKTLLGAVLSLLVTFGLTHSAAAQTRIAFSADVTNRKTHQTSHEIFSMNSDASGVVRLTSTSGSSAFPAWSRNQTYILFHRATPVESTLYVMEANGEINGGRTFAVGPASGTGHDWSPDDSMIVFEGTSDVGYGLWIVGVNADTGEVGTPTLARAGNCYAPSWSPDGIHIAFVTPGGPGTIIKVLDLTTGTETAGFGGNQPSFSPDGSKLAFMAPGPVTTTSKGKTTTTWYYEIFIANADGSGITQMTTVQSDLVGFPKWSADGTQLAFRNKVSGVNWIYKLTLGSGAVTSLYKGGVTLDWAP